MSAAAPPVLHDSLQLAPPVVAVAVAPGPPLPAAYAAHGLPQAHAHTIPVSIYIIKGKRHVRRCLRTGWVTSPGQNAHFSALGQVMFCAPALGWATFYVPQAH